LNAELPDCLPAVGGLGNQFHIRLIAQEASDSLAKDGMVVDREDSNSMMNCIHDWLRLGQGKRVRRELGDFA
jgi:hypothetical protein